MKRACLANSSVGTERVLINAVAEKQPSFK